MNAESGCARCKRSPLEQVCRFCGCSHDDCSGCIDKDGSPCYWVEVDLCSSCTAELPAAEVDAALLAEDQIDDCGMSNIVGRVKKLEELMSLLAEEANINYQLLSDMRSPARASLIRSQQIEDLLLELLQILVAKEKPKSSAPE